MKTRRSLIEGKQIPNTSLEDREVLWEVLWEVLGEVLWEVLWKVL